ncbi:MAG: hypothetical protein GX540_08950 [Clostridiales bacterium]|nr:hypothetical protein [Clostridiales bacterium]
MTEKDVAAIQEITSLYDTYCEQRDQAFETLQFELTQRGIKPTTTPLENAKALAATGENGIQRALYLYSRYMIANANTHMIMDLAHNLANVTGKNFQLGIPKG